MDRQAHNLKVVGSNPTPRNQIKRPKLNSLGRFSFVDEVRPTRRWKGPITNGFWTLGAEGLFSGGKTTVF